MTSHDRSGRVVPTGPRRTLGARADEDEDDDDEDDDSRTRRERVVIDEDV